MKNSLTTIILKNTKRGDIKNTKKDNALSVVSFIIVFGFLAILMISASIYVTYNLAKFEQTYAFVNILLLMNFILLFAKSIFESLNVLYFSKDLKVLLRMPIKPHKILHAKLFNMIISEYEMELIMLAIPMVVYAIYTNASIMFYIYMIGILLFLPVIPIVITSLIISIIMRFTNIIKNKNHVMYLTIILAIILLGAFTNTISTPIDSSVSNFETIALQANGLAESIADSFVLIKPIMNTLLNYDNVNGLKNIIIYILESIICYIACIFIMSKIYVKGAIGATVNGSKRKAKESKEITLKDVKRKNKYTSYLSKEFKILSRTPIFLIECIVMPVIYPIFVLIILVFMINFANKVGVDLMAEFYTRILEPIGQAIFLSIGQAFYMMNFASIIAVSKESKSSLLTKYMPMKLNKQFKLKTFVGGFINEITTIIISICYYICGKNVIQTILLFMILTIINLIGEKFKMFIDLKNPKIDWDNEYTMMKQNTNVMKELFYTLIVVGILMIFSLIISSVNVYLIFVLICSIIIDAVINKYILKNQRRLFEKVF